MKKQWRISSVKALFDTGFLLAILTQRSSAGKAWAILRDVESPVGISLLQLFLIKHGLMKNLLDPKASKELREVCTKAMKLLHWLTQQNVVEPTEIDYEEMISEADAWAGTLRDPLPSLLLLWPAGAAASGAEVFLSFDPRSRAIASVARLKFLPKEL